MNWKYILGINLAYFKVGIRYHDGKFIVLLSRLGFAAPVLH